MNTPIPQVMSWPLDGIDEDGRFSYATDDDSVREVIRNILLTRPGERLRRRTFGAGITDFIHQNNNLTTRTMLANVVRKAVQQWETRVAELNDEEQPLPMGAGRVLSRYGDGGTREAPEPPPQHDPAYHPDLDESIDSEGVGE